MIQRTGVAHWPLVPRTFKHDIDTHNTFCTIVVRNQELYHGVQMFKLYHDL